MINAEQPGGQLPRLLGPVTAFSLIVGSVIGSGIFFVPSRVAEAVPYFGGIVLAWVVGAAFSAAGVLTLAELAAMLPGVGGPYVYLRAAYGPVPAFLFGWAEFWVVRAGSMATLAAAFARAFARLVPPPLGLSPALWQMGVAVSAIAVLMVINVLGTELAGKLAVVGTALKVGALMAMMSLPFFLGGADVGRLTPMWPEHLDASFWSGFMAAMVGILWSYDGWVNLAPMAEEIRDPGRNIPRALISGMATLAFIYLGMTLMYHLVLPMGEITSLKGGNAPTQSVAADYCRRLLGGSGDVTITVVIMVSIFIALNGNAMTGPRAYFAMARDGVLPAALGRVHARFRTPANAVIAQCTWAMILTALGTLLILGPAPGPESGLPGFVVRAWAATKAVPLYDLLYTYVIFGATIFYMLSIASVFVLRRTMPDLPRPYRTWGYPVTPVVFVVASLILLGNMIRETPVQSLAGLGLILLGLPAYAFFNRQKSAAARPAA
ncbi:amino acid permease [Isosphaeraceae bacterium EP7]